MAEAARVMQRRCFGRVLHLDTRSAQGRAFLVIDLHPISAGDYEPPSVGLWVM